MMSPHITKKFRKRRTDLGKAIDATHFSQLTYLLHLITSLNFDEDLSSSFDTNAISFDNAVSDSQGFTLLDSIAAILVQEHEIVAACYTSDKVSVVAATTDTIPATDAEVVHDGPDPDPSHPGSHILYGMQVAAISNPDFSSSEKFVSRDLPNVQIENEGENLWKNVEGSQEGWCYAFM